MRVVTIDSLDGLRGRNGLGFGSNGVDITCLLLTLGVGTVSVLGAFYAIGYLSSLKGK